MIENDFQAQLLKLWITLCATCCQLRQVLDSAGIVGPRLFGRKMKKINQIKVLARRAVILDNSMTATALACVAAPNVGISQYLSVQIPGLS